MEQKLINTDKATWKLVLAAEIIAIPVSLLTAIFLSEYFSMAFWETFVATLVGGAAGSTAVWLFKRKC